MVEACMLHFGLFKVGFYRFLRCCGYRVIPSALYEGVSFLVRGRGDESTLSFAWGIKDSMG